MNVGRRQFLHLAVVAVILIELSGHGAWSQATRTIKVVVPVSPGGASDLLARLLGEQIGRAQGPTIVIEDRPGASGAIGTEAASRAAPDGNTLLIISSDSLVIPHLRKLNYDLLTSFEPICYLVRAPLVIVVNWHRLTARSPICLTRRAPSLATLRWQVLDPQPCTKLRSRRSNAQLRLI
jgi:tripartite-type tricarboxylate transporter receptor subunit TctC